MYFMKLIIIGYAEAIAVDVTVAYRILCCIVLYCIVLYYIVFRHKNTNKHADN